MTVESPSVIVLAGPNGAGKTTAAPFLINETMGITEFVNADTIAQGLSGFAPERSAFAAGRIMLAHLKELAERRETFAFETTLASRTFAQWLLRLAQRGYTINIIYLWLRDPALAIKRVSIRVRAGGHDVPEETIRRRYDRSLRNLVNLYLPLATMWWIYDNSLGEPRLIADGTSEDQTNIADSTAWLSIQDEAHGR